MSLYESLLRPLLFRLDAEAAHNAAMALIRSGALRAPLFSEHRLEQTLFGVKFPNPLGLAAGFDKNAVAVDHWHRLGFGCVEVGTITAKPQPGNPKPRLFRIPEDKALINRMGFNNDGADVVASRLAASGPRIPLGVNLGKSKVTPLEDAAEDYAESFRLLKDHGDYFVVNVSSPNTPGLRELQDRAALLEIFSAIREIDSGKPLFVKIAPDLELSALDDVIQVAHETKLTGLIATNTTISREGLTRDPNQSGGLSGAPLKNRSNQFLAYIARSCDPALVLIGVGGIFTGSDLYEKISLGAHLCQIYTGWIYGGPRTAPRILQELCALMNDHGMGTLSELRRSSLEHM